MTTTTQTTLLFAMLLLAFTLAVSACSSPSTMLEEWRVRRLVREAGFAVVEGLNNRNLSHAIATYFATPSEGANEEELANLVEPLGQWVRDHLVDAYRVRLVTLEVGPIQLLGNGDQAVVHYRAHVQRTLAGEVEAEVIAEGDVRLMKLPRGWVITGGPPPGLTPVSATPTP